MRFLIHQGIPGGSDNQNGQMLGDSAEQFHAQRKSRAVTTSRCAKDKYPKSRKLLRHYGITTTNPTENVVAEHLPIFLVMAVVPNWFVLLIL